MSQQSSGEKTEKASPKKKRDARKKGEVHKSADLTSSLGLLVLFGALKFGFNGFMESMEKFVSGRMSTDIAARANNLTSQAVTEDFVDILYSVIPMVLPLMLVAMLCGALFDVLQTGPLFVGSKLKPDFKKISPLQGFKRIFSTATLVNLFKSMIKIFILGFIAYKAVKSNMEVFPQLMYVDAGKAFIQVLSVSISMGLDMGLALVCFSLVDVLYQWWKYEKDLRMTKQEVKDEFKQTEGDPQVKGNIKRKQRQMSAMRMMKNVPEANVIVTNPDHFAVALRYDASRDNAPVVVAKGQDYLAQKIKELAREHKITIVENKPVARALYASCEVGDEIPPEMYQAIADILIYVYKVLKRDER